MLYDARPGATLALGLLALLGALGYSLVGGDERLIGCVVLTLGLMLLSYAAALGQLRVGRRRRATQVAVVRAQWQARNRSLVAGTARALLERAPRPVPVPPPPRLRLLRDARLCGALSCVMGGGVWACGAVHATLSGRGVGPAEVAALTLGGLIATYGMLLGSVRRHTWRLVIVHHACPTACPHAPGE